ncbi:MAG TPA: DUF308 domain-containing protein [Actinomycetota bacterium]|jgi:uncharacterized membrane protein HdeD (DUF308 family)
MSMKSRADVGVPWWLFLITGIAWLLVALFVLRFNITSIATVGILLGVILFMAGVNEFAIMASRPDWRWFHALMGVLFIVGGVYCFISPVGAFWELAAVLGLLLVLKGAFDITAAVMTRDVNEMWWLGLVVGILEVLLAFWASQQFFPARAALILVWVGFMALFRGITEIVLAFEVRRLQKDVATLAA